MASAKRKTDMKKFSNPMHHEIRDDSRVVTKKDHHIDRSNSKCLTCKHYNDRIRNVAIKTPVSGITRMTISANYCTAIGFNPPASSAIFNQDQKMDLSTPLGFVPIITDCEAYSDNTMNLMKHTPVSESIIAIGKDHEVTINQDHKIEIVKLELPGENPSTIEEHITFNADGTKLLPSGCKKVVSISIGSLKFYQDKDFTVTEKDGYAAGITWTNKTLMVGPHLRMKIKYTI